MPQAVTNVARGKTVFKWKLPWMSHSHYWTKRSQGLSSQWCEIKDNDLEATSASQSESCFSLLDRNLNKCSAFHYELSSMANAAWSLQAEEKFQIHKWTGTWFSGSYKVRHCETVFMFCVLPPRYFQWFEFIRHQLWLQNIYEQHKLSNDSIAVILVSYSSLIISSITWQLWPIISGIVLYDSQN